jgi:deoxyribodipyrimidine photo-lyase
MIQKERIKALNAKETRKGRYVLYWMQASQRTEDNHALEYAVSKANELKQPLVVFFGITDRFPEANERHYTFMLEGLRDVKHSLEKRGIRMVVQHTSPEQGAVQFAKGASFVVVDRGYLRIQKEWRNRAAGLIESPLVQVETDVIVPVEETSPKEEYAAATIRAKIHRRLAHFLVPVKETRPLVGSLSLDFGSFGRGVPRRGAPYDGSTLPGSPALQGVELQIDDVEKALSKLRIDRSVKRVPGLRGGEQEAGKHLQDFLEDKLDRFPELRNDPTVDSLSNMSPYLHFGQISPLRIALKVSGTKGLAKDAYLEELIVRRELSMNFVFYNEKYDSFEGAIPPWAQKTLKAHQRDRRPYLYSFRELESAETHDPYWNAAQKEMVVTGKMHGYMRMYWGKKILEWSKTPEEGFRAALSLNNKYELDGRDPNGFTGVAWCFGKHDRPWGEREIFGNVRYMNAGGLKRKFDADEYVRQVDRLRQKTP